jgi:uncharacterized membrane protein
VVAECKLNKYLKIKVKMKKIKNLGTIISAAVLGVLTFLVVIPFISADANDYGTCGSYGMMNGFFGGYGFTFMIISWIILILLIVLIVSGIYWLIKSKK